MSFWNGNEWDNIFTQSCSLLLFLSKSKALGCSLVIAEHNYTKFREIYSGEGKATALDKKGKAEKIAFKVSLTLKIQLLETSNLPS